MKFKTHLKLSSDCTNWIYDPPTPNQLYTHIQHRQIAQILHVLADAGERVRAQVQRGQRLLVPPAVLLVGPVQIVPHRRRSSILITVLRVAQIPHLFRHWNEKWGRGGLFFWETRNRDGLGASELALTADFAIATPRIRDPGCLRSSCWLLIPDRTKPHLENALINWQREPIRRSTRTWKDSKLAETLTFMHCNCSASWNLTAVVGGLHPRSEQYQMEVLVGEVTFRNDRCSRGSVDFPESIEREIGFLSRGKSSPLLGAAKIYPG